MEESEHITSRLYSPTASCVRVWLLRKIYISEADLFLRHVSSKYLVGECK